MLRDGEVEQFICFDAQDRNPGLVQRESSRRELAPRGLAQGGFARRLLPFSGPSRGGLSQANLEARAFIGRECPSLLSCDVPAEEYQDVTGAGTTHPLPSRLIK